MSACGFAVTVANHLHNHDILYVMLKTVVADVTSSTESISESAAYVTISGSIYAHEILLSVVCEEVHMS